MTENARITFVYIQFPRGYFDDPEYLPGLAHLCEHLLMRGNDNDGIDSLAAEYSAQISAVTQSQAVVFNVTIDEKHAKKFLQKALAFVQQFIPSRQAISDEINIIEREFCEGKTDPVRQLHDVERALCSSAHPFTKFPTGNAATFGTVSQDKLRNACEQWISETGKTVNMTLGEDSLEWRDLALPPLFTSNQLPSQIALYFPLPAQVNHAKHDCIYQFVIDLVINNSTSKAISLLMWLINFASIGTEIEHLQHSGLIRKHHAELGYRFGHHLTSINIRLFDADNDKANQSMLCDAVIACLHTLATWIARPNSAQHLLSQANTAKQYFQLQSDTRSIDKQRVHNNNNVAHYTALDLQQCLGIIKKMQLNRLRILSLLQCNQTYEAILELGEKASPPVYMSPFYHVPYQVIPFPDAVASHKQKQLTTSIPIYNNPFLRTHGNNDLAHSDVSLIETAYTEHVGQHEISVVPVLAPVTERADNNIQATENQLVSLFCSFSVDTPSPQLNQQKRSVLHALNVRAELLKRYANGIGIEWRCYPHRTGFTLQIRSHANNIEHVFETLWAHYIDNVIEDPSHSELNELAQNVLQQTQNRQFSTGKGNASAIISPEQIALNHIAQFFKPQMQPDNGVTVAALSSDPISSAGSDPVLQHATFIQEAVTETLLVGAVSSEQVLALQAKLATLDKHKMPKASAINRHKTPTSETPDTHVIEQCGEGNECCTGILFYDVFSTGERSSSALIKSHADWMLLAQLLQHVVFDEFREKRRIAYSCGATFMTNQGHPGMFLYVNHHVDTHHNSIIEGLHQCIERLRLDIESIPLTDIAQHLAHSLSAPRDTDFSIIANYYWMLLSKPCGLDYVDKLKAYYANSLLNPTQWIEETTLLSQKHNLTVKIRV